MADKQVKVKVTTEEDLAGVEAIENRIQKIKQEQIQLRLNAKTEQLDQANQRIEYLKRTIAGLEAVPPHLGIEIDESEVQALKTELASLEHKSAQLQLDVEKGELEATKSEIEALDGEEIEIQLRNQSAMEALDQIKQGVSSVKNGAMEVGQTMGTMLESAGKQETNKTFLSKSFDGDVKQTEAAVGKINEIVSDLPGDDTALQGLLSSAVAKDHSLLQNQGEELDKMATNATDYFQAMAYYGKPAIEAQQDMNNYLMTGQTAEIERSPILAAHVDKLKEASTVQERNAALAEALTEEGWAGMGTADTYNNKLDTFNGMLERGRYNLGGMFQEGAKQGMNFLLQLDESSNGLVGMGLAVVSFVSPVGEMVYGLGQTAMGMKAIKDLGFLKFLKNLELTTKLSAAAQWLWNLALDANPILLIVLAVIALIAVLGYLYFNNEQVRAAIDGLGQTLMWIGQVIYTNVISAVQWLMNMFNNFTNQLGLNTNNWMEALLGFILFIPQLPLKIGIALTNTIAKLLGFKGNFINYLTNAASSAINGFISYIQQLPGIVLGEFNRVLGLVNDFINTLPDRVWDMGQAIIDALKKSLGIGSPGHMFYMMEGEFERLENLPGDMSGSISGSVAGLGDDIVNSFNPELGNIDYANNLINKNNGVDTANGTGDIIINIEGDVDSDRRIKQIVDAVRRELSWDNRTAGRTI